MATANKIHDSAIVNLPDLWLQDLPEPAANANKYTRGHAFLLGGEFMTGSGCLACRAAQRIGAGLVTVACANSAADVYRIVNPSASVKGFRDTAEFKELLADTRITALLVGPGMGDGTSNAERIMRMLHTNVPIVLDADVLNIMAQNREPFLRVLHQRQAPETILLTPHQGEFERLFPEFSALPASQAALQAASLCQAVVVYKQPQSYIATPEGILWREDHAPAWLATAGSGDVLAGLCLGLISQGLPASNAALIAHYVHAEAAKRFGPGLIAEDLNTLIPAVYTNLLQQRHTR